MKEWKLLEALGDIDSALLSEPGRIRIRRKALAAAAVAAALVLAFGVTLLVGAVSRPELPVFYSVNGSLYRRATNAGAILLEMLPSSCHGEKVGEAKPVEITDGMEAVKPTAQPNAATEPNAAAAPHATLTPIEPSLTVNAEGFSAWSVNGDGGDVIIISGGIYVKAAFGEVLKAKGFAEDEEAAIRDGYYVIAEGDAAKDIYRGLWNAAPVAMYAASVPGFDEQVAVMLAGDATEEEIRNLHAIMDIHTLVILNSDGYGVSIEYLAKANCFIYRGSVFTLAEDEAAALNALLLPN